MTETYSNGATVRGPREILADLRGEQITTDTPRGEQSTQSGVSPPKSSEHLLAVDPKTAVDSITILRTRGPLATKTWRTDGTLKGYDDACWFTVEERPLNSIYDLARVLSEIERDPRSCVIRGRLKPDAAEIQRDVLQSVPPAEGQFRRKGGLFDDVAHHWVMLDVDGFEPKVDPIADPVEAISEFLIAKLPAFCATTFYWQMSSSAGHPSKSGLRAHLWFWLSTPATSEQVKAWSQTTGAQVDRALFNPVQVHYTAAPVFAADVADPVPKRSGVCEGLATDDVSIEMPEVVPARTFSAPPPAADAVEPLTEQQVADLRACIPFLDWDDRHAWIGHLNNMKRHGEQGRLLALEGSRTSAKFDADEFGRKWAEPGGDRSDYRAWFVKAANRGWVNPAIGRRPAPDATGFDVFGAGEGQDLPTGAELVEQIRQEPREKVVSTWSARAAHLSRTEAEEVIEEVKRLTGIKQRALQASLTEAREAAKRVRAQAAFERDVAGRKVIEVEKGELGPTTAAAEDAVLSRVKAGEYVVFGGRLSRVAERELPFTHLIDAEDGKPPVVPVIEQLASTEVEATVGKAAVFIARGANGQRVREHVPPRVVDHLMAAPSKNVPRVSGLISHPVVMPDGEIVSEDGLHERSRLFLHSARIDGLRPYTQTEAAAALARLRAGPFAEFEFASDADVDVAVASLFTAMQRRIMDTSPGLAVLASRQSSGKTTLARVLHLLVTGRDLPVTTLADDESETQKRLLALLMRSPEVVCIDNVPDGFTFRSASLSAAMTSGELHQRVLGETREASVPTSVMFVITGNNLTLGTDEVTRWMPCRLAPKGARPEERRFRHPDVVGNVLRQRESVLRDGVGIVAGFIASGAPMPQAGSRFSTWDRVVRAPLIWAGASDVAEVFRRNREESADEQAQVGLLLALRDRFGAGADFRASAVAEVVRWHEGGRLMSDDPAVRLVEALAHSRVRDSKSVKSVASALNAVIDRVVEVDGYEIVLRKRVLHGVALYRVEGGPPKLENAGGEVENLL